MGRWYKGRYRAPKGRAKLGGLGNFIADATASLIVAGLKDANRNGKARANASSKPKPFKLDYDLMNLEIDCQDYINVKEGIITNCQIRDRDNLYSLEVGDEVKFRNVSTNRDRT